MILNIAIVLLLTFISFLMSVMNCYHSSTFSAFYFPILIMKQI